MGSCHCPSYLLLSGAYQLLLDCCRIVLHHVVPPFALVSHELVWVSPFTSMNLRCTFHMTRFIRSSTGTWRRQAPIQKSRMLVAFPLTHYREGWQIWHTIQHPFGSVTSFLYDIAREVQTVVFFHTFQNILFIHSPNIFSICAGSRG